MTLLGRGARAGVMAAQSAKARRAERKETARVAAEEQAAWEASQPIYDEPPLTGSAQPEAYWEDPLVESEPAPKQGLLARMPSLIKRPDPMPEPEMVDFGEAPEGCLLYTSPSPRDQRGSRMPSSA